MKHSLKLVLLALLISVSSISEAKSKHHTKKATHSTHHRSHHTRHHESGLVGIASWYGYESTKKRRHHAPKTASGEVFNPARLTAAHRSLPFGTKVLVTNLNNHRTVIVVINDRGPFIRGRIIDLSKAAAQAIGMHGTEKVSLTIQ